MFQTADQWRSYQHTGGNSSTVGDYFQLRINPGLVLWWFLMQLDVVCGWKWFFSNWSERSLTFRRHTDTLCVSAAVRFLFNDLLVCSRLFVVTSRPRRSPLLILWIIININRGFMSLQARQMAPCVCEPRSTQVFKWGRYSWAASCCCSGALQEDHLHTDAASLLWPPLLVTSAC